VVLFSREGADDELEQAEVGAGQRDTYPDIEGNATVAREIYGLDFELLPRALVKALSEPLLSQRAAPPGAAFPTRLPSWWQR
jgi:hypothetical protein